MNHHTIPLYDINVDQSNRSEMLPVNTFPWTSGYRPETHAILTLREDVDSLVVRMVTNEWPLRAVVTEPNGPVYKDSCMEFFLMPAPGLSSRYINFEINPLGVPLIEIGDSRNNRERLVIPEYRQLLALKSQIDSDGWSLDYQIPLPFLNGLFGEFSIAQGYEMRGNFYKCGDATDHPHYACWAGIDRPVPDFHVPEFFGTFVIS